MAAPLSALLRPRSVAVVGAAERESSSGGAVLRNLAVAGFRGQVIPVHPRGGSILGHEARRSLKEIDPPADLAVIVIRPDTILEAVREAADSGHRHILILPGGFAEAGPEGLERDRALRALAAERGLTIAGPNCAGVIDLLDPAAPFAASFLRAMPRGGGVALISQSGAIAEQVIAKSHELNLPFGAVISVGNALHLGITEYLEHYGSDPTCAVIALYVESFGELARFRDSARAIARRKPIVALVGGRTGAGALAVKRHTGAVAMDTVSLDAMLADAGVLRVANLRELLIAAKGLGAFPQGLGGRALLLSNSGGPGVLAADAALRAGLALPELPSGLEAHLRQMLPAEAAVANPLDLLADAREDRFAGVFEAATGLAAGAFDAILGIHVVPFMVDPDPVVRRLAALAGASGVPMMHTMMGTLQRKAEWFQILERAGVPAFDDGEEMLTAAAFCARYRALRAAISDHP
jgi:acyl-CoA synthetase (NDP forming)